MAPAVAAMLLLLQNCSGEPLHVARVRLLLGNDPVADAAADQTPLAAVDLDQRTHHAMLRSRTLARRTLIRLNDDWSLPLNALTTPRTGVPVSGSHTGIACPGSLLSGRPLDNEAVADHSGPPPVQVDTLLTHLTVAPVPGTLWCWASSSRSAGSSACAVSHAVRTPRWLGKRRHDHGPQSRLRLRVSARKRGAPAQRACTRTPAGGGPVTTPASAPCALPHTGRLGAPLIPLPEPAPTRVALSARSGDGRSSPSPGRARLPRQ